MQNQAALSELKTLWSHLTQLPKADSAKAKSAGEGLVSKWDRAVSHGIVPKGRADRKKARIAAFLTKLTQSK